MYLIRLTILPLALVLGVILAGAAAEAALVAPPPRDVPAEAAVKERLKKYEAELVRIRAAMLKECDDAISKLDELIKKADKKVADAGKDFKARNEAFQERAKVGSERARVLMLRYEVQRKFPSAPQPRTETAEEKLGLYVSRVQPAVVQQLGLGKDEGMAVIVVVKGSAAEKAGLQLHDILLKIDGKPVSARVDAYRKLLAGLKTDVPVDFVVLRRGKKDTIKGVRIPASSSKGGKQP